MSYKCTMYSIYIYIYNIAAARGGGSGVCIQREGLCVLGTPSPSASSSPHLRSAVIQGRASCASGVVICARMMPCTAPIPLPLTRRALGRGEKGAPKQLNGNDSFRNKLFGRAKACCEWRQFPTCFVLAQRTPPSNQKEA